MPALDLLALLDELAAACAAGGRRDLVPRVAARREKVAAPRVCVVVAGDFKAGKSSLVNALVGADVCPVDDDVATSVPTLIRFAPEPGLRVRRALEEEGNGHGDIEDLERLAGYATERGNPDNGQGIRIVEVGLPSPLLEDGLVLVDTPGIGGLRSTYAAATMTALALAHAVLFVSDASQEYTGPELEFLEAARQVCPEVVAVLTKVDIVPEWRRIRDLDEGWLDRTGLPLTVVPTSAALQLEGRRRDRVDLREESGLAEVALRLRRVAGRVAGIAAAAVVAEVHAVVVQLAAPLRAEHDALADPERTIEALEAAAERARQLTTAPEWLAVLDDTMTDLETDADTDLARRMKDVLVEAQATVRATDPASNWDEFGAALARQVSSHISAVAIRLTDGANALASDLARRFAEDEAVIVPTINVPDESAGTSPGALRLGEISASRRGVVLDAGWGGMEALGVLGSILTFTSINLFNPFSLVIGVFIGGKSLRDSRRRELERRREQAVESVTRYLQDAIRAADHELKASSRRIRRQLRTTYQRRADALNRSARESLAAAERTIGTDPAEHESRRRALRSRLADLEALDRRADTLAAALDPPA